MNRLNRWPHVHVCVLDPECWRYMWRYGMPMRVGYKDKFWTIPILRRVSRYRSNKVWDWEHPVRLKPKDFRRG